MHQLFLEDETPENERARLDPDHWYEINLTNATLFANLTLEGMGQVRSKVKLFDYLFVNRLISILGLPRKTLHHPYAS